MNKPLRLIELFAGYGSQALALDYLNIPYESWFVCDFDKYAIQSYNDIHNTNYVPADITKISANDMNIIDTKNYDYLLTYSFPCTDLSNAGKQAGMTKGSGTRSGLLWEVERLLSECKELPQYLLMENVPQVIGKKNIDDFKNWCEFLTTLGYTNSYKVLNAKDYGIPQNRERCFMISVLNGKKFKFPEKQNLTLALKDMLETVVDDKYYLSDKAIKGGLNSSYSKNKLKNRIMNDKPIHPTICARYDGAPSLIVDADMNGSTLKEQLCNYLIANNLVKENDIITHSYSRMRVNNKVNNNLCATLTTRADCFGVCVKQHSFLRIRKLTPKECLRLMGVKDKEIDKFTVSNNQKYKQAGNSIVVNVLMAIFKNLFIDKKFENGLF